ncbi:MAG: RNA polymerase sigma factor [Candidatus Aminicenantes bacterium]|nr:RNA polymerase sigma factor [Candidatus Aminicenantes bacterium]
MNEERRTNDSEQELTRRLKTGDPGAFKELVENLQDRVLNTCYRFVFNREDAEDIAQEVFIEVHRSITAFKGQSRLSTWVYRVAVTKSIDYVRKSKRKKRLAPLKSLFGIEEDVKNIPAAPGSDPAGNLEQEERKRILLEAISALPENQRIVFTLSKYKGLGNKEIAGILGSTLSSVESLMHRAKKNLEKKLYHYFEADLRKKRKFFVFFASQMIDKVLITVFFVVRVLSGI